MLGSWAKNTLILPMLVAGFAWAPGFSQVPAWGSFEGRVAAEWTGPRNMRLTRDFTYVDPRGKRWTAPRGAVIDGASIPQFLWSFIGSPFTGSYRDASVVHDYYCDTMREDWRAVHRMFYHAMRARGVSERRAKWMFAAVYGFGPRWITIHYQGFMK